MATREARRIAFCNRVAASRLLEIAGILKCAAHDLFNISEETIDIPKQTALRRLMHDFTIIPEDQQGAIRELVQALAKEHTSH